MSDWDLRYRPLLDGSHGILGDSGNDNSNVSSKLDPYIFDPFFSSDDELNPHTPSIMGSHHGLGAMLLSYFIQTSTRLTAGMDSDSSDNSAFGIKNKSDAIVRN